MALQSAAFALTILLSVSVLLSVAHGRDIHDRRRRGDHDRRPGPDGHPGRDTDEHATDNQGPSNDDNTDSRGVKANLPDHVDMNIPMKQGSVKLKLKKSDTINASLPVFIGTNKYGYTQMDTKDREDFAVYEDQDKQASFVMWNATKRQGGNFRRGLGMRGIFDEGGESFSMEPLAFRDSRLSHDLTDAEESVTFTFNDTDFVTTTVNRSELFNSLEEQAINEDTQSMFDAIKVYVNKSEELGHQYPRFNYEIEILMVVDFAIFNKWLTASSARDYKTRELDAIDDIRFYFAHILNGMAMRYMSVNEQDFEIRIVPIGLYIAKTQSASFWTESYPVKEAYHYTEAYKALDLFEEWINDDKANLPPFDQATLFSGNNLFSGYYNGKRRTINGLASITGICGYTRASLNYDQGLYGSIQNAAHELGHNLGSYHDGYNNECQSKNQYIMATSPGVLTDSNFDNVFKFSYCSKRAFWEYLLYLNSKKTNCLLERTNTDSYWNYEYYLQTYLGQRYTADEQCKLVYGPHSSYCGGGNLDEAICSKMYCWRPQEGDCHNHIEQRAGDGTTCGDRKWCMEGDCVSDSRAPTVPDATCIYGDFLGIVDTRDNYRCEDVAREAKHLCYDKDISLKCCETCESIREKDKPECEFGDRTPSYCSTREARDCYDDNVQRACCATCASFERDDEGCKYGDRSYYLCRDARNTPRDCYPESTNSSCCETCPQLVTGPKGCEYGDKNSWCRDIRKKNQCYQASFAKSCCNTCKPEGPAGCEFGDRSDYCTQEDCKDPNKRQDCCKTCGSSSQPSGGNDECPSADQSDCSHRIWSSGRCYDYESSCCNTCQQYKTDIPNCKFGDKLTWCPGYVSRNGIQVCSNSRLRDDCCLSCAPYLNGDDSNNPGEPCIDDATWCSTISSGSCYDEITEDICCKKCKGFKTTSSTCPYGDKYSWCAERYCGNHRSECCATCT